MAPTADSQLQAMIRNMPEKTGKPFSDWKSLISQKNFSKHGEILKFLKLKHGVSHGYANTIAHLYLEHSADQSFSGDDLIAQQYNGKKSKLLPIYDALIDVVKAFGSDVEIAPKKTYVSLRRHKQFAIIKAATQTRVDLGLNLKGVGVNPRIETGKVFNGMCTHLVRLNGVSDIDDEVVNCLLLAYKQA